MSSKKGNMPSQLTHTTQDDIELYKHIGIRIKEARTKASRNIYPTNPNRKMPDKFVTQTDLGNAIKVTFQQIQKYEKATNKIPICKLVAVSKYLKKPLSYFIPQLEEPLILKPEWEVKDNVQQ
jgi:transcriptional regulator with XRE-family HTH domain